MGSVPTVFLRFFYVAVLIFAINPISSAESPQTKKKILMLAGPQSHEYGSHEHLAGLRILSEAVQNADDRLDVDVREGWPNDTSAIDNAAAIVIYCDGKSKHLAFDKSRRAKLEQLLRRGGGLVALHYATEMLNDESGDEWRNLLGGHFETHFSVNPEWIAQFKGFPQHPTTNGLKPFAINDEWYFHLRFSDQGKLTPILQAVAPESTMRRPDGDHSGNSLARKSVADGELQTVAWAFEPTMGGRSFGFTGGHYHWNWANTDQLMLLTNAIRWVSGNEISKSGSHVAPKTIEDLVTGQDEPVPLDFNILDIKREFRDQAGWQDPADNVAILKPIQHAMTPILQTDKTSSIDIRLEFEWAPSGLFLGSGRSLYLVATDAGSGSSAKVAWVEPVLKGPKGLTPLTDLPIAASVASDGKSATVIHGEREIDSAGLPKASHAIVTRTNSILKFRIPVGYEQLLVKAVVIGAPEQATNQSKARFAVYADAPPVSMNIEKLADLDRETTGGKRDPANAVSGIALSDDLTLELMGSEPELRSLTNLDIDHRGRVWVCDVMNYRRLDGLRSEGDRILILEDTTGDGKLDSVKTYYQGHDINAAMGICVLENSVIVSASPHVWKFTDTDGDDVPDTKVALFSDTGVHQQDHSAHSFVFGPDGKLYWNFGNTGHAVKNAKGEVVVDTHGRKVVDDGKPFIGGMVFRCNMDGSELEVIAHNFRNPWETTIDSFGGLWQSDNDDDGNRGCRLNFLLEQGNYGYRDEITGGTWREDRIGIEIKVSEQHWHLNDPGVVPNLRQTGAGSPAGIEIYEGNLLPARFHSSLIHCDPGPGEVRLYPLKPDGAGYQTELEIIAKGESDDWFRPVDVCTAPDGSVFITDWYDSIVGGALQGDSERGRLFRLSPTGTAYKVPTFDFDSIAGCVSALCNPNRATRYLAWKKLHEHGSAAEDELRTLLGNPDARLRARALWLLGKIDGKSEEYVKFGMADRNENVRAMSIRLAKQCKLGIAEICGQLAQDDSPSVRRELATALRFDKSVAMPKIWAQLAVSHVGNDRWYLEALGIGSDLRANECFDTWVAMVAGVWNTKAGRDIVWRVRASSAADRLIELIQDESRTLEDTDRYFRAMEYHERAVRNSALSRLLTESLANDASPKRTQAERDAIMVRAIMRVDNLNLISYPDANAALGRHIARQVGTGQYLDLVRRFRPEGTELPLRDMVLDSTNNTYSLAALRLLIESFGKDRLEGWTLRLDRQLAARVAGLLGTHGSADAIAILGSMIAKHDQSYDVRSEAVRGLCKSIQGQQAILAMAESGHFPTEMQLLAGGMLSRSLDYDVKTKATVLLPVPDTGKASYLPPLDVLVSLDGDARHGMELFRGVATCANCHIVNGTGKEVGPNLSEIGDKLSREAMFAAIINPSDGISHNYEGYSALLNDGRVVTGLLFAETAERIVIRNLEAIDIAIDRNELIELKKNKKSIMPDGLLLTTNQQGLVDVVTYLTTLRKKP